MTAHHEIHLETYIVKKLLDNGWVEGNNAQYDPVKALYPEDVVNWIKVSQLEVWDKLVRLNGSDTEKAVLDRLEKALLAKTAGTIKVLRQGFEMAGAGHIAMSQAAPEDTRNNKEVEKYRNNRECSWNCVNQGYRLHAILVLSVSGLLLKLSSHHFLLEL